MPSASVIFCTAVVLLLVTMSGAQEEEAQKFIDFWIENEETKVSKEQLVMGKIYLYGQLKIDKIGDLELAARTAMSRLCSPPFGDHAELPMPVATELLQDIKTLGQRITGFIITFWMLAPLGGGMSCLDKVSMLTFGPEMPPWEPIPAPPYRILLAWEMQQNTNLKLVSIENWRVKVGNLTCDDFFVRRPVNFPDALPATAAEVAAMDKKCDGTEAEEIDWAAKAASAWEAPAGVCEYAPHACICAAIPGCGWVVSAGRWRCRQLGFSIVPCTHCPIQPQCTPEPAELCAAAYAPCTCVASRGGCVWVETGGTCIVQTEGIFTPCSSCARQNFCAGLEIVRIKPRKLSVMGKRDVGWLVNVTFNRRIWLGREGLVQFQCTSMSSSALPAKLAVGHERLVVADQILHVDLRGLINAKLRDCDLMIDKGVVQDRDLIKFQGLDALEYTVTLPDTAPPELADFEPANSAVKVPLDTVVRLKFNEVVEAVAARDNVADENILLIALGNEQPDGSRESDMVVASISIHSNAEVSFSGTDLQLDMGHLIRPNVQYSIAVPSGLIADSAGNLFAGLDAAVYAFRTSNVQRMATGDTDKQVLPMPMQHLLIIAAAAAAVSVVSSALLVALCIRCHLQRPAVKPSPADIHDAPILKENPEHAIQRVMSLEHIQWGGEKPQGLTLPGSPSKQKLRPSELLANAQGLSTQSIEPWRQHSLKEHANTGGAPWQNAHHTAALSRTNRSTNPSRHRQKMDIAGTTAQRTQVQIPTSAPLAVTDLSATPGEPPVAVRDLVPPSCGDLRATARMFGNPIPPDALPNAPVVQ